MELETKTDIFFVQNDLWLIDNILIYENNKYSLQCVLKTFLQYDYLLVKPDLDFDSSNLFISLSLPCICPYKGPPLLPSFSLLFMQSLILFFHAHSLITLWLSFHQLSTFFLYFLSSISLPIHPSVLLSCVHPFPSFHSSIFPSLVLLHCQSLPISFSLRSIFLFPLFSFTIS